ncbi:hypothetical protein [Acetobacterium sp.]|uniref:hypothetical protein n=1 Tax=Acetobacterium sp. TaxID=1872094 RepID=UPI00271BBBE1|nr:hypothetical protein [Acetobacterium sp.]MDO9491988.1 hypothetical protein [Acetobacterium sp.]
MNISTAKNGCERLCPLNQVFEIGQTVKTTGTGLEGDKFDKNKKVSKPGIVLDCYDFFVLVQLQHSKKCFFYNQLEIITKKEYQDMIIKKQRNPIKVLHHGAH